MKKKYIYLIVIFLIVVSFTAFGRILSNGFINFDDRLYITENNHIKSGINPESIKWAFSAVICGNWHPLTLLSHTLDWSLFGANASGHHLINLLLHIGSVLFLFFFLKRTTKSLWPSAFAAALFALHPLRVESVAWAAERKDVLSMFFGLASIYAYACYAESSKLSRYFLCLILFAFSLMAKPMLVTMPFVLLLLDYWPLERWQKAKNPVNMQVVNALPVKNEGENISAPVKNRSHLTGRLLWEKTPFIFLTIISSIITLWAQNKDGAVVSMQQESFLMRVANAIISYISYLGKTFWPVDLAVFYPPEHSFALWQILVSCFILIGITAAVIYAFKKLPFLFVGWFWYLGTLIPVIGLVQVGSQAMADRYTYLPSIGITIMLVWGIVYLLPGEKLRKIILMPATVIVLSVLAIFTWQQCGYWRDSINLFNHALQVTKDSDLAHSSLGLALFEEGKIEEAIDHYNEAISITPGYQRAYNSRGTIYAKLGQYQRAIEDYENAIRLTPNRINAYEIYNNKGFAYANLGQKQLAIEDYNEAIRLKQDYAEAYYGRGTIYGELGQYQTAIEDYNEAIRLKPYYTDCYYNRGFAYARLGQYQRAVEDYNEAIRLKPDYANAYNSRAAVYFLQSNNNLGCLDAQKACALGSCKTLEVVKSRGYCL